jgi:SAM-dependent methyltransferase
MNKTDAVTKKAWEKNWDEITIPQILEIFNYVRVKKQMAIFTRVLPKNEKILEGGCGLAPYLITLRRKGYDVEGIDYNDGPIQKILQYDPSLPVKVGDVTAIPYPDRHFGAYMSLGVIEHFSEGPQKALAEANRVLKPGGVFVVSVPTRNIFMDLKFPITWLKKNALLRKLMGKPEDTHYWEQYFKKSRLIGYLEGAGFEVREVHPLDHSHTLVAFSSSFRDKNTYDEASPRALRISEFFERKMPWLTASQMTLICYKKGAV